MPRYVRGAVAASQTVTTGDNVAAFTSSTAASGGTGAISYQWKSSSISSSGPWLDISGATSATYDHGTIATTTYFTRYAVAATCGEAYSNVLTVSVEGSIQISDRDIVHDLYAVIPVNAEANDYVLEITPNMNWRVHDALVYEIESGSAGIFKIESDIIKIDNPTTLAVGTYNLSISVTDSIFTDQMNVSVVVASTASSYFIDPSVATSGSGTRASPYKGFSNYSYTTGKYYFFKRGSTTALTAQEIVNASTITLGAYGTGARPIIQHTGSIVGSAGAVSTNGTNITLRDIDFYTSSNGTSVILGLGGNCNGLVYDNLIVRGNGNGPWQLIGHYGYGITGGAIRNCEIYNCLEDGLYSHETLRGTSSSNMFMIEGNYVHDINRNMLVTGSGSGDGMDLGPRTDFSVDKSYMHIRYNLIDKTNVPRKHCILYGSNGTHTYSIIEHNSVECWPLYESYGMNGISLYLATGTIVRYNEMWNGTRGIYTPADNAAYLTEGYNKNLQIYGNLLYNNLFEAILLRANADSAEIYNNTIIKHSSHTTNGAFTGIGVSSGSVGNKIKNNIIHTEDVTAMPITATPSAVTEDYNLFYPNDNSWTRGANSIEGDPGFVTGFWSQYDIDPSSPAYRAGTNLGIIKDAAGDLYYTPTASMGWKEYVISIAPAPARPPSQRAAHRIIFLRF